MNKKLITLAVQSAIFSAATVMMPQALAMNAEAEKEIANQATQSTQTNGQTASEEKVEKITVTGSRLRRDSFSVATPLATMDREALEDTGLGSLSEILIDELPQISEGSSNTNSQSSVQNTGLSTIDLRELGTNRTLTLIDGRRAVSNSYSGNYVSLSTIPSGMVKKVEIITGGASAAYGSDAVAGVVNIITQQDKEGFSFKTRGGETAEGGGRELTIDTDYGTEFGDGKGYLFVAASYDRQYGLSYYDRKRAQQQDSWWYDDDNMCNAFNTADGFQCMRDITMDDWTSLSDSIPGGVFDEKSSSRPDAGFWYDENGLRSDWHEERYGIDTNQFVMLKVPDEAISGAIKANYELNDDHEAYFQVQYSQNNSFNLKAPESEDECDAILTRDPDTGEFGQACIGRIPRDNPFVPEEIREQASSKGIKWDRNFAEVGNIATDNTRTTIRSWAGVRGVIFDGEWDYDLSIGFGKFKQEQFRSNEINVIRAAQALDAEVLADGTIQCADADARAAGCVPLNLFGIGSISPEAADYIRQDTTIESNIEQTTILGYVAGDLFEMPAGPVATAFGFEYRKDSQSVETNVPNGGVTFNYVPTFEGDVSVYEVFGEASFPLLQNEKYAKSLSADVSLRLADYSMENTSLVKSYRLGFIYQPVEGYGIRANWARAQRAPTITELMSPQRGDYDGFDDICDGLTLTSTGAGHDACRQEPTLAAVIADGSEFRDENNGYSPNVGNMDLFEETADTYTLGLTMSPIDGLQVAIDYYDITITDAISSFSNEDIIEYCYNSDMPWGSNNTFCNDISRDEEGNINGIMQRVYNVDEIETSGYDLAAEYRYDLGEYGRLKFKLDYTHVIGYSQTVQSPDGPATTNYEGDLSQDLFEDKGSASLSWYKDGLRVRWSTKVKGQVVASRSRYEDWQKDIEANNERCLEGDSDCVELPEELAFFNIPTWVKHNLSVSYKMELDNDTDLRLFGGVNNVFDNNGAFILGGKGNYDSQYGGGVGRFYYLGAEVKF